MAALSSSQVRAGLSLTMYWNNLLRHDAGTKYEKTEEGLLIRNVSRQDGGGYICRARVAETGQLEERKIQLEVIQPMLLLSVMVMHICFSYKNIPLG